MKVGAFAPWYRWIEYAAFGRALERCRFAHLTRLAGAQRVLILGEGDGRTLARLLKLAPQAHFDVFEISPEMIALARERTRNSDHIAFHQKDARVAHWTPRSYDAIVTNFFLDCLNDADARGLIDRLARALTPEGIWLVSEFAIPKEGWRRTHARIWIATMYRFFRIATGLETSELPSIEHLLREAGMQRVAQEKMKAGLIVSEVWRPANCATPCASPQT